MKTRDIVLMVVVLLAMVTVVAIATQRGSAVVNVTVENFKQEVTQSAIPVYVEFHADW